MNDPGDRTERHRKPERPPWAKALVAELKRLGFPVDHFATLVGVNPSTLHRWMLKPLTETREVLIQRAMAVAQADPLRVLARAKGNGPKEEDCSLDESQALARSWALVLAEAADIVSEALGRAGHLLRESSAAAGDDSVLADAEEIARLIHGTQSPAEVLTQTRSSRT
jgi:hypothetical protein